MKRLLICLVLFMLLLAPPAAAQEATPEAVPTDVPATEGDIIITVEQPPAVPDLLQSTVQEWGVLIIATIALVAISFVACSGIVQAAAGVPKEVFDTAVYGMERGLDVLDRGAIATPTPLDDAVIAELRLLIADLARRVEENRTTVGAQRVEPTAK